jgi:hypothetical protein
MGEFADIASGGASVPSTFVREDFDAPDLGQMGP